MLSTKTVKPVKGHFIFNNTFQFANKPFDFFMRCLAMNEDILKIQVVARKIYMIFTAELAQHVLQKNNKNYRKSKGYKTFRLLLGDGLLTSEGDFWMKQRRLAQPAFHRKKLAGFVNTMVNCTDDLLKKWEGFEQDKPVNMAHEMMEIALQVVTQCLFSASVEIDTHKIDEAMSIGMTYVTDIIRKPLPIPLSIPTPKNQRFKEQKQSLDDLLLDIIKQRRNATEEYDDLLTMLMGAADEDTNEQMTDKQLLDELVTIFLAGHETSANALTWLFMLLAQNPQYLPKLQAEIETVLQGEKPTLESIRGLTYTKQVIQEAMRLYPPAWLIVRAAIEEEVVANYTIPKDKEVFIPVYAIHRSPKYWKNPSQFNPDNFSPEAIKARPKYAYIPFGGGPRFCIGSNFAMMEMQIIVAMILQKYTLTLSPTANIELEGLITLRPKHGMDMFLHKR